MTSVSYSVDNGTTWVDTAVESNNQTITTPTIAQGDKVLWKGEGSKFSSFSSTGNFNVMGNIMSLLYGDNFENQTSFPNANHQPFQQLFYNVTTLVSAENLVLPATTLCRICYQHMFRGCTSLTTPPSTLPAQTLVDSCYGGMFMGCSSLTTAPTIEATTVAQSCCVQMFQDCTSLTTGPTLKAAELNGGGCYQRFFSGCTNLNSITMLATNITANNCLLHWVNGVAASGTFTKAASMTTLPTATSDNSYQGIPDGWTVVDA